MSGITPPGWAAGDAQQRSSPACSSPASHSARFVSSSPLYANGDVSWQKKRYIFVSGCSGIGRLSTWDHLAGVLLSSPGPRTLVELLQVGRGHGRTYLPQNITCFYSDSWCVRVTLEREETAFFSEEELKKKASVLKQEYLVLYTQEKQRFPITSWF